MRPRQAFAGLAAMVGLLAVAACNRAETPAAAMPPPAVQVAAVRAPDAAQTLTATGPIERRREMTLSFRIAGVMTALNVEAGDPVRAGQVLATLDPAGVAAAEARASVDVERARRDLARDRALYDKGFVSKQRLDDRESALKAAQAGAGSAAFDRRWAKLVAPASGVVLERRGQAGEVVQPGQAVLRIADEASPLVLRAPLADRDVLRVRPGATAVVTLDALPGQALAGRVVRVGEAANAATGSVELEIEITSPPPALRSGQMASARIAALGSSTTGAGLARIPAEAILEANGGRAFVLTLDAGSRARRRAVTFAGFDGDDALVGGLSAADRVITAGAGFVSDGEKVSVVDPARLMVAAR